MESVDPDKPRLMWTCEMQTNVDVHTLPILHKYHAIAA